MYLDSFGQPAQRLPAWSWADDHQRRMSGGEFFEGDLRRTLNNQRKATSTKQVTSIDFTLNITQNTTPKKCVCPLCKIIHHSSITHHPHYTPASSPTPTPKPPKSPGDFFDFFPKAQLDGFHGHRTLRRGTALPCFEVGSTLSETSWVSNGATTTCKA